MLTRNTEHDTNRYSKLGEHLTPDDNALSASSWYGIYVAIIVDGR